MVGYLLDNSKSEFAPLHNMWSFLRPCASSIGRWIYTVCYRSNMQCHVSRTRAGEVAPRDVSLEWQWMYMRSIIWINALGTSVSCFLYSPMKHGCVWVSHVSHLLSHVSEEIPLKQPLPEPTYSLIYTRMFSGLSTPLNPLVLQLVRPVNSGLAFLRQKSVPTEKYLPPLGHRPVSSSGLTGSVAEASPRFLAPAPGSTSDDSRRQAHPPLQLRWWWSQLCHYPGAQLKPNLVRQYLP